MEEFAALVALFLVVEGVVTFGALLWGWFGVFGEMGGEGRVEEGVVVGLEFGVLDEVVVLVDDDFGGEVFLAVGFGFLFKHEVRK